MSDALQTILDALDTRGLRPKQGGREWRAFCPVHENPPDGHKPSLCIGPGDNGAPLLKCQGGCATADVLRALGMRFTDLYPAKATHTGRAATRRRTPAPSDSAPVRAFEDAEDGITLGQGSTEGKQRLAHTDWAELGGKYQANIRRATLKRLARDFGVSADSLARLGVGFDTGVDAFTFPMRNAIGEIVGLRYRPRKDPHSKYAATGSRLGLFVPEGVTAGAVEVVAEGETDCAAALTVGLGAIGLPGAGQCLGELAALMGQSPVACPCIVGDQNDAGRASAERTAEALLAAGIPCRVLIPPDPHADLRAWATGGKLTEAHLRKAIAAEPIRWPGARLRVPGFSQVPNAFTRRGLALLGPGPLALAVLLASFNAGDGDIHPSREELARVIGVTVSTIDRWKRKLRDAGVLRWHRGREGRCDAYSVDFGPCKELRK